MSGRPRNGRRAGRRALLRPARGGAGFTFIEILIVMAIMAVLMGLGIGILQNVGYSTRLEQAKTILRETAWACKAASTSDTKATMLVHSRPSTIGTVLTVETFVARPVLTAHFETLDFVSQALPMQARGGATLDANGFIGKALRLERGGWIEFQPQASFAMTEGIELDCMVRTQDGTGTMCVLRGEDAYEVLLVRASDPAAYDVHLRLKLGVRSESIHSGDWVVFATKGSPVRADGSWRRLQVRFDGRDASIRVDGLERYVPATTTARSGAPATGAGADDAPARRIAVPETGAVRLGISSAAQPFTGWIDFLVLGGVFRSSAYTRELPAGLRIASGAETFRASWSEGRLDPPVSEQLRLVIADENHPEEPAWQLVLGAHGTIHDSMVAVPAAPTSAPARRAGP